LECHETALKIIAASIFSYTLGHMTQSFTATDTAVIQRARRKRRDVLVLREDETWLREYSPDPTHMLWRMAQRGALISLGAGRYAIPAIGTASPAFKAWQPMLHARLAPHGNYYLAGLSAMIDHRLTDISDPTVCVVIEFSHGELQRGRVSIAGKPIRAVRSRREVFSEDLGIETIQVSRSEHYRRSNRIRTLVDCLWHPELCGETETWVSAWGRADLSSEDARNACLYAAPLGISVSRRLGVILELVGHGEIAREHISRRSDRPTALVANGPKATDAALVDRFWSVVYNVPQDRVEGWLSYGK
jgi:predicted transcriptional regulator of viral defense system